MEEQSITEQENSFVRDILRPELAAKGITIRHDGIVDEASWKKAEVKLLFLLKEPVGNPDKGDSLLYYLRNTAPTKKDKTWRHLAQWVYALMHHVSYQDSNTFKEKVKPISSNEVLCRQYFKPIVAVNLKKQAGKSRSNPKQLKAEFHNIYKKYIVKQLRLYKDADIIVCCGDVVWDCLKECYTDTFGVPMKRTGVVPNPQYKNKFKYFVSRDTPCVMNFWHPSYPKVSDWDKCSNFLHVVETILEERKME